MAPPTLLTIPVERLQFAPGSLVTIPNLSWEQYEQILISTGDRRAGPTVLPTITVTLKS